MIRNAKRFELRRACASAATGLALMAAPALAQNIPVPSDPVAKAAFDVLEKHCARCHQEGLLSARDRDGVLRERKTPAKSFGNVLLLEEMVEAGSLIEPGNPGASSLAKLMRDKEMPYDVYLEGVKFDEPSEAEIKAVEAWIAAIGATGSCEGHKFVGMKDMVRMMTADLETLPKARAKGTRYLYLTQLTNVCTKDKFMEAYRQGAIKLVNSLSRSAEVVRIETIDPERSILRINIDDLGWAAADWETLVASYPYAIQPDTRLVSVLETSTGTKASFVRADWFAFAASRPGMYEKLLKLPKTFRDLAREQGVDVAGNIRKLAARRAGVQASLERESPSPNNRLLERHSSKFGYFWTTYDFAGTKGRQSLFQRPLGPGGAKGFVHDASETIFSLPNGFQGYFMSSAKGDFLQKSQSNVLRDKYNRRDPAIVNAISCMRCHVAGILDAQDEIRPAVLASASLAKADKEAIEALYPPPDKMTLIMAEDAKRFADAMLRAGLDPSLKLNGVEVIFALSQAYEANVNLVRMAAEFGLTKDDFIKISADVGREFRTLIRRVAVGPVPRDEVETIFKDLAKALE
jgi:hypothetical protein